MAEFGNENKKGLRRVLTVFDLMALGVGGTVGAGVFALLGNAAKNVAGPSVVLSFLIAGISCVFSALCYAEFAARLPVSGSAYIFAYASLGELVAFIIGWNLTLEYGLSAAAISRAWSGYIVSLSDGGIPSWFNNLLIGDMSTSPLSVVLIAVITVLLTFGTKESSRLNAYMTTINITLMLFIIGLGASYIDLDNYTPFIPFGVSGTFQGASSVFFSFIGFDAVACVAEEVRRPARDLPLGIIGTLFICTSLYVSIALVLTGMVPYNLLDSDGPLAAAFGYHGNSWAKVIVAVFTIAILTATSLCSLFGQPRIYYAMAKDGLFFSLFKDVHPRFGIPVAGTLTTGAIVAVMAFAFDINILADMISLGTLQAFAIVCGGILILRYRSPTNPSMPTWLVGAFSFGSFVFVLFYRLDLPWWTMVLASPLVLVPAVLMFRQVDYDVPTTFKCPFVPLIPMLGIFANMFMMLQLPVLAYYSLAVWTVIGLAIYFLYGMRFSKLAPHNHIVPVV
eukprot:GILK01011111.1.p1 GENE.GILK01011111.1~~GILK01011111.1.p1  ORF type:complete len:508 (+),score=69.18 GILK01011111.1:122-1645(+)